MMKTFLEVTASDQSARLGTSDVENFSIDIPCLVLLELLHQELYMYLE